MTVSSIKEMSEKGLSRFLYSACKDWLSCSEMHIQSQSADT